MSSQAEPVPLRVEPVTQAIAQLAAALLRTSRLHGHKYAIDAVLCAMALAQPGRATILNSGVEDIRLLTADHPRVVAEKVWPRHRRGFFGAYECPVGRLPP